MSTARPVGAVLLGLLLIVPALALPAEDEAVPAATIRRGIEQAIPLIQAGGSGYLKGAACFSCHHQAMAVQALTLAEERGFKIDRTVLQSQVDRTVADLRGAEKEYRELRGQGGQVTRAGYALYTLGIAKVAPEAMTSAVATYILSRDRADGYWRSTANRPPSEASPFTATFLALRGLRRYGAADARQAIEERRSAALAWLKKTPAKDQEDRVFRLLALSEAGGDDEALRSVAAELLQAQRADGGWNQLDTLGSDAYATGSALVALRQAGGLGAEHPAVRRGVRFLLANQLPDGSWHVASRSKPFQAYFESGFPHGKDQWISMAASSWAASALALALPPKSP